MSNFNWEQLRFGFHFCFYFDGHEFLFFVAIKYCFYDDSFIANSNDKNTRNKNQKEVEKNTEGEQKVNKEKQKSSFSSSSSPICIYLCFLLIKEKGKQRKIILPNY